MENKTNKIDHTKRNFVIKLIICINFFLFLIAMVYLLISGARDEADRESIRYRVETCDWQYYKGHIVWLRNYLGYYDAEYDDMDDEVLDVYREVVKAYEDFAAWRTWHGCLGTELDAEAQIREPELREAVYANAKNCADVRNQKMLGKLVEEMEAMIASATEAEE